MKRSILTGLLLGLVLPICLALAAIRVKQDERGAWTGQAPEVEVIYLPNQADPALWVYLWGSLVWQSSGFGRRCRTRFLSQRRRTNPGPAGADEAGAGLGRNKRRTGVEGENNGVFIRN